MKSRKRKRRPEPEVDQNQEVGEAAIERNRRNVQGQETGRNRVGEAEVEIEKIESDQKVEIAKDQNHVTEKNQKNEKGRDQKKNLGRNRDHGRPENQERSRVRDPSLLTECIENEHPVQKIRPVSKKETRGLF